MVYCYPKFKLKLVLKDLRINRGLTQQSVAEELGVSRGYISQVESTSHSIPNYDFLIRLLDIYRVKPKYFEELISMKNL